jgi:3-phosphoshikimate 1-carboxyvinyltransferase
VEEGPDGMTILPQKTLREGVAIDTYDDHRMAMSFSLVALGGVPVVIKEPGCVAKTFPEYFQRLEEIVVRP